MTPIDLRSDTITRPTPAMRKAMFEADVGDDVYGEDPTVNKLEALAARMLGKEAALFVASGTQGNQVAVLCHTRRGDEVIVEAEAHMYYYEVAGIAHIAGCQARPIHGVRGAMDPGQVAAAVRSQNVHFPRTSLICIENTHNRGGGAIVPASNIAAISEIARKHGIAMHLDGARIFNAAVALKTSAAKLAEPFDSVMFCLSKGLGAPIGSILAGRKDFITEARRMRKMLGGGMRQVGVVAAAGIVSLEQMVERLEDDHKNARTLAAGLVKMKGIKLDPDRVETNMVLFELTEPRWDAATFSAALAQAGVLTNAMGPRLIRLVTHADVSAQQMPAALERIEQTLARSPEGTRRGTVYG